MNVRERATGWGPTWEAHAVQLEGRVESLRRELSALANQLDRWAAESIAGAETTHRVDAMRREADRIRRLLGADEGGGGTP